MKALRILALGVAIVLGGCDTSEPVLLNASPEGVVVRYSQASATYNDAALAAAKFCAQYKRKAVTGDSNSMTGDTFVSFRCEEQ